MAGPGEQAAQRTDEGTRNSQATGKSAGSGGNGLFNFNTLVKRGAIPSIATAPTAPTPFTASQLRTILGGKSTGSTGGVNPAGQPGPVAIDPATGLPVGSVPDATGATGLRGPTGPLDPSDPNSPQLPGTSTSALGTGGAYQGANSNWQNRDLLDRILSNLPFGFGYQKPNVSQPSSYAAGDYHFGFNPASLAGGIAGMAVPFGGSAIGTIAGLGYDALGGKDVILGGPGATSVPGVTPGVGAPGTGGAQAASVGNPTGGGSTSGGGGTGGAIPSATPTASQPSAAVPVQAAPAAASTANSQQPGQKSGGTIITGSNSIAWPWSGATG